VPCLGHRVGAVGGLTHDLKAWLGGENRGEALAHHSLIVDDQAARVTTLGWAHAVSPSGSTADTENPPVGVGPADSDPPSSSTRSRIPVRP
jgi:hypothetical protein